MYKIQCRVRKELEGSTSQFTLGHEAESLEDDANFSPAHDRTDARHKGTRQGMYV